MMTRIAMTILAALRYIFYSLTIYRIMQSIGRFSLLKYLLVYKKESLQGFLCKYFSKLLSKVRCDFTYLRIIVRLYL